MARIPEDDFPILKKHSDIILSFAKNFVSNKFRIDESNHFVFMVMCFLTKQIEHFISLMSLINAGQFSDSTIIARIMMEGMATISWVSINPDERAYKWRNYSVITDYKTLLDIKRNGLRYSTDQEKEILERLKVDGNMFLKEPEKKQIDLSNINEKSYRYTWLFDEEGNYVETADLFKAGKANEVYAIYKKMNSWIHWNVLGIGKMIKRETENLQFSANKIEEATLAMAAGFASLHYILFIANECLSLNIHNELKNIEEAYLNELELK